MFRALEVPQLPDEALERLSEAMTAAEPTRLIPEDDVDPLENPGIPAGYTYLGQFIDHDVTFDPLSSLSKQNDPDSLTNFRSPALDLDCMYGRGMEDQPYLYAQSSGDPRKLALGDRLLTGVTRDFVYSRDVPRFRGRALIGDPRNDGTVITSQLHGIFVRFHNFICDQQPDASFAEVQRLVRWHYQWLVLFDFLPRIIGRDRVSEILPHLSAENIGKGRSIFDVPPVLHFYRPRQESFIPIEFTGAVYRFGHSMIRPAYRLSREDLPTRMSLPGLDGRKLLFHVDEMDDLRGLREFPSEWGIDWRLFFPTQGDPLAGKRMGKQRVQPAYKIDTSLVWPLAIIPEFSRAGSNDPKRSREPNRLALRNLQRGASLALPSGQAVARAMGIEALHEEDLRVGSATVDGWGRSIALREVHEEFEGQAPLWFYVLAEAQHQWSEETLDKKMPAGGSEGSVRLGKIGGRLVGEVLIGLLLADRHSFLSQEPTWRPALCTPGRSNGFDPFSRFGMGDLVDLPLPI